MKTLHLNLASRPYRNLAPVYGTAVALAVLCAVLLIYNVQTAYRFFVSTEETRAEIARVEQEIQKEQSEAQRLEASVQQVDVKRLNAESEFINTQIEDRTFSWSRLLDDMESVLPRGVRLLNLDPTIDEKSRDVKLSIAGVAKTHGDMITFLRRMLADPRFIEPFPNGETLNDDGTVSFTLSTGYRTETAGVLQ